MVTEEGLRDLEMREKKRIAEGEKGVIDELSSQDNKLSKEFMGSSA